MILERLGVGSLGTNCYILAADAGQPGVIIDPGGEAQRIVQTAEELGVSIAQIVLTHYHFDHVLAAEQLRKTTGATIAIHRLEVDLLAKPPILFGAFAGEPIPGIRADLSLKDGDLITAGDLTLHVLHTPGHSPGGISLWLPDQALVLTGDALFAGSVGRHDLPGSDAAALVHSIREKLYVLPVETVAYPGHGPETTIGRERHSNAFVRV